MLRISAVRPGSVDFSDLRYHRSAQDHANYTIIRGDLLVVRYNGNARFVAACGMVRDAVDGCVYPDKLIRIRVDPAQAIPEYVELAMLTPDARRQLDPFIKTAAGQHGISGKDLRRLVVTLPPLAEQRRIVARIEALFARTRRARADLERIASLGTKLRQTSLASAYEPWTRGASPAALGEPFFGVLEIKGGTQPPKATFSSIPRPGFVRLLQIRDFASDSKAVYIEDSSRWAKCGADDIMVGRYGASVGKIMRGKEGAYNVALIKVTGDWRRIDRDFLFWWLQAPDFQDCVLGVSRSAQNGFNKDDLRRLQVPLPPMRQQLEIVAKLRRAFETAHALDAAAVRSLALLDRLEQRILARAFRGELVQQEPADSLPNAAPVAASPSSVRPRRLQRVSA